MMNDQNYRGLARSKNGRPIAGRLILAALIAATGLVLSTGTATSAEPTAEALLDKYVEAMGGKTAMEKIENRVTRGKLEIPAQGIEMTLALYSARPNLTYMLVESDMVGTIEKGSDGDVYWEKSAMMGTQIKEGQERTDYLRESVFDKWLHWRDLYPEVEYAGSEDVEGKPAHKVVVKPESGEPQTLYLDQDSSLAVRVDAVAETPMGTFPVVSYMRDYREIDGILIPHLMEVEVMGQKRMITTDKIEHNVELPADRFTIPADVRAIQEQETGEPADEVGSTDE